MKMICEICKKIVYLYRYHPRRCRHPDYFDTKDCPCQTECMVPTYLNCLYYRYTYKAEKEIDIGEVYKYPTYKRYSCCDPELVEKYHWKAIGSIRGGNLYEYWYCKDHTMKDILEYHYTTVDNKEK